jgi:hypothetical protein
MIDDELEHRRVRAVAHQCRYEATRPGISRRCGRDSALSCVADRLIWRRKETSRHNCRTEQRD